MLTKRAILAVATTSVVGAALVAAPAAPAAPAPPAPAVLPALPPGGSFVAVAPHRVLDTRTTGGPGTSREVQPFTGLPGVPASSVAAVLLNVTVVDAAGPGYVAVGSGQGTSNGNYVGSKPSATLALVRVPPTAVVPITTSAPADVVVDVQGYVTTPAAATAASYTPLDTPRRAADSRKANGLVTFGPGQTQILDLRAHGGLPTTATAAVVNVTVAGATGRTYVTGWSGVGARPVVSTVNADRGDIVANRALLPVDAAGQVALYNAAGRTDLVVDVVGYVSADPGGSYFTPVAPSRMFDSTTTGASVSGTVDHAGGADPRAASVTDLAPTTALWLTLVGDHPIGPGYLAARPSDVAPTGTSDLNLVQGRAVANAGPVRVSAADGGFTFVVSGSTRVVVDLSGWFRRSPAATPGLWSGTQYPDYTDDPTRRDTLPTTLPASFARGVYTGDGPRSTTVAYALGAGGTVVEAYHGVSQPSTIVTWSPNPARIGPTNPTQPGYLAGITQLASAGEHLTAAVYALDPLGNVYGFQSNVDGELGTTPNRFITYPLTPTRIPLPVGVVATAVYAAQGIGYAVGSDGTVYSWGRASNDQLGRDATTTPWVPAPVTGLTSPTAIAGDGRVTFALDADGATYEWGAPAGGTAQATPAPYAAACATASSLHTDYNGVWELCEDGTVVQLSRLGAVFSTAAAATLQIGGVTQIAAGPGYDNGIRVLLADGRVAEVPQTAVPSTAQARYVAGFAGVTAITGSPGVQITAVGG